MIHLEKDQKVAENENLRVAADTGDYTDSAAISCYDVTDASIPLCSFQAQYVMYGGIVYRFNDPKDLGAAILQVDRNSTHMAASFVRMNNELLAQMNDGSLESDSLNQVVSSEQANVQDQLQGGDSIGDTAATSTDPTSNQDGTGTPVVPPPATNSQTATSTAPVADVPPLDAGALSTSTPESIGLGSGPAATSSDSVIDQAATVLPIDTSTSTPISLRSTKRSTRRRA